MVARHRVSRAFFRLDPNILPNCFPILTQAPNGEGGGPHRRIIAALVPNILTPRASLPNSVVRGYGGQKERRKRERVRGEGGEGLSCLRVDIASK